jgi:hypothetical protein
MTTPFEIRMATNADNAAILSLIGAPQPSNGVQFAFERVPDYFQSALVSHQSPHTMVVERRSDKAVVAMVNLGHREVFVDGQAQTIRYGSDLRIASEYQGSRVLIYINRAVRECIQDSWYQSVILEENDKSRGALEGGRAGLPLFKPMGGIITHTITGRKRQPTELTAQVRVATVADISAMNRFVQGMAAFYQFLPAYNFWDLEAGLPYFNGLKISDFLLLMDADGDVRGLVGLWNQKTFKQTRVVDYSRSVALFRPFYNVWSSLTGGFVLPAKGETFDYLALHSPLTSPDDSDAFRALLHSAWLAAKVRGNRAITLTIADSDPRGNVLDDFRTIPLKAYQYTAAFREESLPTLDSDLIPYFESGRL